MLYRFRGRENQDGGTCKFLHRLRLYALDLLLRVSGSPITDATALFRKMRCSSENRAIYREAAEERRGNLSGRKKTHLDHMICAVCNKKLLVPMTCRCGNSHCIQHRHRENHQCPLLQDKTKERELLAKKLPKLESNRNLTPI